MLYLTVTLFDPSPFGLGRMLPELSWDTMLSLAGVVVKEDGVWGEIMRI